MTTRGDTPTTSNRPVQSFRVVAPVEPKRTWTMRMRSLFCCFAPPASGYVRGIEDPYHHGRFGAHIQPPKYLREAVIGPKRPEDVHKKTLVLDLDETLVHSSFKPIPNPDYILPVSSIGTIHVPAVN